MARTIVDIPSALLLEVDHLCQLLGISRAEAVRRALGDFLRDNRSVTTDGFGLWRDPGATANALATTSRPAPASAPLRRQRRRAP